ncbi:MAG: DNA primase small subunit domain-containing protein, partial [Candidatus Woesearchaeota archaeon]
MATGEMDYYFRDDVRQALVRFSKNREAVAKNHDTFFKRPDTLSYANDVDYLIKKGATSFHVSEEIWDNPLAIQTGEKKKDLDDKRIGWDLILDVDCKFWKWAKKITHRLIEELKAHGIKSISCKFSGNKGFHIAVPWECFPKTFAGKKTSDLFPDLPRRILKYLIDRRLRESITKEIEHDDDEIKEICKTFKITREQLFYEICSNSVCNRKLEIENRKMYCKYCQSSDTTEIKDYIKCNKCGEFFANENIGNDGKTKYKICVCGNDVNLEENRKKITEIKYILDVDAILIAPRHLYRMQYSLHEKSGYVSIPIDINEVLNFNKESAEKEKVVINKFPFLN